MAANGSLAKSPLLTSANLEENVRNGVDSGHYRRKRSFRLRRRLYLVYSCDERAISLQWRP